MPDPRPIRWLHLSDLHCGCKGRAVWEQVEEEFHRDLDQHLEKLGPPDLLLFTGDLAFSGRSKEYAEVDRVLDAVFERLGRSGVAEPILLAVPGNHDVAWPSTPRDRRNFFVLESFDGTTDNPVVAEIHDELWREKDPDISFIEPLFPGYIEWFERRVRPALERRAQRAHFSHFPCDFVAEVEPEGAFPLAVLGLNSTWIQYTGGDFDGKLLIPIEQYRSAIAPPEGKPAEVFERNAHTLMLVHQPPGWLSEKGREIFDASIYRPRHITACLFGHMHEGNNTLFQSAGGEPRVFLQSPSLFGVEKWGKSGEDRAFGYSWGQLGHDGEIRIWPRKLDRRGDGVWSFGADPGFHERPEGGVLLRPGQGSSQQVAVEQRGIALDRYLAHVISQTDTLEIRGIAGDRNQSAVCPPIENLYTPLRMRAAHRLHRGLRSDPDGGLDADLGPGAMERAGTVNLREVLSESERILIEGEPGAGKTTFLRLVACMLARDASGLPCPGEKSWRHAHLGLATAEAAIPVFLRLAALVPLLSADPAPKAPRLDDRSRLLDLLEAELHAADLPEAFDRGYWQKLFEEGKVWLLLDGLDEVDDLALRERVFTIARDAITQWPGPVVVASRPFQTETMTAMGFRVAVVEPFRPQEIQTFLEYWSYALYRQDKALAMRGKAERYRERLEGAILSRPKVRALARNPVMLTCLCVVHWNRGDLPDVRSRVYEAVIRWLLNARANLRLERFELDPDFAERALATLALHGMGTAQGKQSILGLDESVAIVAPAFERARPGATIEERSNLAHHWLLFECEGSGVVEEVAGERLRFWHLTFQEFLAALELARMERETWWPILKRHLERAAWRETSELFVTCLYDLGRPERLDWLLGQILSHRQAEGVEPGADAAESTLATEARTVGTIGRLLQPLRRCGYEPATALHRTYEEAGERAMAIFTVEGAGRVPVADRIAAAEALGQGGDPRLKPETFESNLVAVEGQMWKLAKYPVTVAEYKHFVDERGYEDRRWWSEGGWSQKSEDDWSEPGDWEGQLETPNRPVVRVSWWEAEAYCHWLSDLRGLRLRLPKQAEWEVAATHPQGDYPWGAEEPNTELANYDEGNVGHATPVGVYPRGNGPYGHCDLAGNVWEWCLDELDGGVGRPLRGGSWLYDAGALRSAFRDGDWPRYRFDLFGFRLLSCPPSLGTASD